MYMCVVCLLGLEDDTDELLDLIARRDQYHTGQGSKFKDRLSNSTSAQLSPSPTRRHHSSKYKYKTTLEPSEYFDDCGDTMVKGNFTPAPAPAFVTQAHSEERDLKKGRG